MRLEGAQHDVAILAQQVEDLRRQLARSQQQLMDSCKARSSFLANMSHELRTPLNAIIGYSELVLEEIEGEELHDDVSRIHGAAQRLLSLISGVLDLSRIEAGRVAVQLEGVDAAQMIRDAAQYTERVARDHGTEVVVEVDELPLLITDGDKLAPIVQNLMDNAVKFTRGGRVWVRATMVNEDLVVEVEDEGIGIDPVRVEHLFDAFVQGDDSTTRRYGGLGVGLALSRAFAELMGGHIEASSVLGEGSVFRVTLPADPAPRGALRMPGSLVRELPPYHEGELVLVVDDDPAVHDLVRRTLDPLGFVVRVASTGEEGLRLAHSLQPQLVILDVRLPGVDGLTVLETLRADAALADMPVLLMSMIDERVRALRLGASDYLVKPVDRERLVGTVERLLIDEEHTVLVAEDDETTREMVCKALRQQGWSVLEARTGQGALDVMRQQPVHAVLLDLMMPEVDGFQVAEHMREDPALADIPVVVLTAMDLTRHDLARLRGRVDNVLLKGAFGPRDLMRQVREMVRPFRERERVRA